MKETVAALDFCKYDINILFIQYLEEEKESDNFFVNYLKNNSSKH